VGDGGGIEALKKVKSLRDVFSYGTSSPLGYPDGKRVEISTRGGVVCLSSVAGRALVLAFFFLERLRFFFFSVMNHIVNGRSQLMGYWARIDARMQDGRNGGSYQR